jgi:hypothetical protein
MKKISLWEKAKNKISTNGESPLFSPRRKTELVVKENDEKKELIDQKYKNMTDEQLNQEFKIYMVKKKIKIRNQ